MIRNFNGVFVLLVLLCTACVPIAQQIAEKEALEIEGFIGPLVIDKKEFTRLVLRMELLDPEDERNGKHLPIYNCKCYGRPEIIQDKLLVTNSYGGGESNRPSTKLFWNGIHHKNSKGQYVVDVILHSDFIDVRRSIVTDRKIHEIKLLQRTDVKTVWINLVGYESLIQYNY